MSRLTRDETAESVSRDQILKRERDQGNIHFPYIQLTTCKIGNLTRLIHTLAICVTIHTVCWCMCVVIRRQTCGCTKRDHIGLGGKSHRITCSCLPSAFFYRYSYFVFKHITLPIQHMEQHTSIYNTWYVSSTSHIRAKKVRRNIFGHLVSCAFSSQHRKSSRRGNKQLVSAASV